MTHKILIVDDEVRLADVLQVALEDMGYESEAVASSAQALARLSEEPFDLVLTDLRMPDLDGRALLHEIKRRWADMPVVMLTAFSSMRDAVDLIKDGAFDYIAKPFDIEDIEATIARALRLSDVTRDNERLRAELEGRYSFDHLIGNSPVFRQVIRQVSDVCESKTTVLLLGESGTGKEVVARAVHFNSPRRKKPFVAVNCAAIPEGLMESELFGHVKGAFTGAVAARAGRFAQASGGTLFLDEIGDMPLSVQAKILRVLQERTFEPVGSSKSEDADVRIIAATHKDLRKLSAEGDFREDLYYRLNVFPIELPSLHERITDLPLLFSFFVRQFNERMGKRIIGATPEALNVMAAYRWPGNIRELQNCIERAMIVARGPSIDVADLPRYLFEDSARPFQNSFPSDLDQELERLEKTFIVQALEAADGVQAKAAGLLGIAERSLWHRIKKLGIKISRRPNN